MAYKKKTKYTGKGQTNRLIRQHKKAGGVEGIFGKEAKKHDASIEVIANRVLKILQEKYPYLEFRRRTLIYKKEINKKLKSIDKKTWKSFICKKLKY